MRHFGFLMCILIISQLNAQRTDYHYIHRHFDQGGVILKYNEELEDISVSYFDAGFSTLGLIPTITNNDGEILFYYNGFRLYDSLDRIAINGDGFSLKGHYIPNVAVPIRGNYGLSVSQNACAVNIPNTDNFVLFNGAIEVYQGFPHKWDLPPVYDGPHENNAYTMAVWMSIVRPRQDGRVEILEEEKEIPIIEGFLRPEIAACQHANGRDWWILIPNLIDDQTHKILVDSAGVHYKGTFTMSHRNSYIYPGAGNVRFNADGTKMVRSFHRIAYNSYVLPDVIEIWDFDRCTGEVYGEPLAAYFDITNQSYGFTIDVTFSPNGRFLYYATGPHLLQFDLHESDPFNSPDTIMSWNGDSYLHNRAYFSNFWTLPNGKILVNMFGLLPYLHLIDQPDEKGADCDFIYKYFTYPIDPNTGLLYRVAGLPTGPDFRMLPAIDPDCLSSSSFTQTMDLFEINAFPNPFTQEFHVNISDDRVHRIEVYNFSGIMKYTYDTSLIQTPQIIKIPAHQWTDGAYLLLCKDINGKIIGQQKVFRIH